MGGSINYHRKVLFMLDGLRFVILRSFLGSICLFVQSYSSLYSFTHKQIDHQKQPRNLTKLIYRNALIGINGSKNKKYILINHLIDYFSFDLSFFLSKSR